MHALFIGALYFTLYKCTPSLNAQSSLFYQGGLVYYRSYALSIPEYWVEILFIDWVVCFRDYINRSASWLDFVAQSIWAR